MSFFNIVHLYSKELNLYGDTGNILYLQYFLSLFNIKSHVYYVGSGQNFPDKVDFIFAGGGPDSLQNKIYEDFIKRKEFLKEHIESGKPSLFICGSYQLLGKYYLTSTKDKIKGLGLFDFYTESPPNQKHRIVGNCKVLFNVSVRNSLRLSKYIVGFQNHNGRTFFNNLKPLGFIKKGYGNNGVDLTEGLLHKKLVGSYFHGPILVKNPQLLFFLLENYLPSSFSDLDKKVFYPEYVSHYNLLARKV